MPDIMLPITSATAIVLVALHLILTFRVIGIRRRDGVVLGDNDDRVLTKAIRGQANASEQIPLGLIMLGLCELQGGPGVVLAILAVMFTIGRVMHGLYFAQHGMPWHLRFYGMLMTLSAQIGLVGALIWTMLA